MFRLALSGKCFKLWPRLYQSSCFPTDKEILLKSRNLLSLSSRLCSTATTKSSDPPSVHDKENWRSIFKFPYIKHACILNRLKLYQTCFMVILTPVGAVSWILGSLPLADLTGIIGVGCFSSTMLYIFGSVFRKMIGNIFINEQKNLLKVAHMTFFGRRNDIIVPVADIMPVTETNTNSGDTFLKCCRYSDPKSILYFCVRFGGVKDKDEMDKIFDLESFKRDK